MGTADIDYVLDKALGGIVEGDFVGPVTTHGTIVGNENRMK